MKNLIHILLFVIGIVTIVSCKKDPAANQSVDFGYNYFPDEVGKYVIYEVDSIAYDDVSHPPDTTRYLLKEVVASIFLDNANRLTMRLERFYKMYNDTIPYDSMNWIGPRVWTANRTQTTIEKKEENITYLKLIFPVGEGKKWNGNAYNNLGQKEYEIISVDRGESINGINFDSVLTVEQFLDTNNLIQYIYGVEKFAKNIGLIYKESDSIYDGNTADSIGYIYRQKIVSYGQ